MVNAGDTAWVLASAALVMLMTPGLAFFYGGMVRSKSVLNMLMLNFVCLGIVGVLWALYGFSLAFGNDIGGGLLGSGEFVGLANTVGHLAGFAGTDGSAPWPGPDAIPLLAFCMFQLMFAVITPALISGAIADRTKFWTWSLFVVLWATIVYFPVAHWVFSFDGFIAADSTGGWIANANKLGALDFAGGTAVHINAGAAGLALAIVLGKRRGWPREPMRPHNLPFVLLGASLLWFGWFGFNGGSGFGTGNASILAFTNTLLTPACTLAVWMVLDAMRDRKVTAIGAATAMVVGCVAITPAGGYISPGWAMALGAIAALPSYALIAYRTRTGVDETLDVLAAHGTAGLIGILFVGLVAQVSWNGGAGDGLFYGDAGQLGWQVLATIAAPAYAFVMTAVLLKAIGLFTPLRATADEEAAGMDITYHGEEAYASGEGAILLAPSEAFSRDRG